MVLGQCKLPGNKNLLQVGKLVTPIMSLQTFVITIPKVLFENSFICLLILKALGKMVTIIQINILFFGCFQQGLEVRCSLRVDQGANRDSGNIVLLSSISASS